MWFHFVRLKMTCDCIAPDAGYTLCIKHGFPFIIALYVAFSCSKFPHFARGHRALWGFAVRRRRGLRILQTGGW